MVGSNFLAFSVFNSIVSHQIVSPAAIRVIISKIIKIVVCPFGKLGFYPENTMSWNYWPKTRTINPIVIKIKENPLGQHPNDFFSLLFSDFSPSFGWF